MSFIGEKGEVRYWAVTMSELRIQDRESLLGASL